MFEPISPICYKENTVVDGEVGLQNIIVTMLKNWNQPSLLLTKYVRFQKHKILLYNIRVLTQRNHFLEYGTKLLSQNYQTIIMIVHKTL